MPGLSDAEKQRIKSIIVGTEENSVITLVSEATRLGESLYKMRFSTSQIRNIFGVVRSIEQRVDSDKLNEDEANSAKKPLSDAAYRDLVLLKPKLAYQYGRATNKPAMGMLQDTLNLAIDYVERDRERFKRFVEFFEAILAYHRYFGGSNS